MIGFKIIHEVDGQRTEVYTSVAQTQSLFDCLVDKIGDPESWTKLRIHENGVHALGWRKEGRSGCWYPVRGFKDALDQYFQQLCTRQDRPTVEIYLWHCIPVVAQ